MRYLFAFLLLISGAPSYAQTNAEALQQMQEYHRASDERLRRFKADAAKAKAEIEEMRAREAEGSRAQREAIEKQFQTGGVAK